MTPRAASGLGPHWRTILMPSFLFPGVIFCFMCLMCEGARNSWSYKEELGNGPSNWFKKYPTCGGRFQSPVDLKKEHTPNNVTFLVLEGHDKILKKAVLINNGDTVQLSSSDARATLSGGCLGTDKYDFVQLHFHWGRNDSLGSEHTVMGRRFSMEGHFVHKNKKYRSMDEAKKHADGLAVLGVFYRTNSIGATFFRALIKAVKEASQEEINVKIKVDATLNLRKLMPDDMCRFYCYRKGSLTTPGCDEAVTWTVMEDTVPLSRSQMEEFRRLRFEDGTAMINNFRPVQELNGRKVYFHGPTSSNNHWSVQKCGNGR